MTENVKNKKKLSVQSVKTSIPSIWDTTMVTPIYLYMPHFKWTSESIKLKSAYNYLLKEKQHTMKN